MQQSSVRTILVILAVLIMAIGGYFLYEARRSEQARLETLQNTPQTPTGGSQKTSTLTLSTSDDIDLLDKEMQEIDIEGVDQELDLILQDAEQL